MVENKSLIETIDLKKDYVNDEVETKVLYGLDLKIRAGEFTAIMGPSGSGKSTLMHILGFLDTPTSGHYYFKGQDTSHFSDDELARIRNEEVGFVFQAFNLLPKTTVYDNVRLPLFYSEQKNHDELIKKAIAAVDLNHRAASFSNQLSGGEKQRVAIARALVTKPSIIFADEPTGNLDSKSGQVIMEILEKLNNLGHTIILVTHEKDTAKHAKRIIQLRDGLIVSDETINGRRFAKDGELAK